MTRRQGRGGGKSPEHGRDGGRDRGGPAPGAWDPRQSRGGDPADRRPARKPAPPASAAPTSGVRRSGLPLLYGFHTVAAALANPRRVVHRVFATAAASEKLVAMAPDARVKPTVVPPEDLARLVGADAVHQGVVAEVDNLPALDIHDVPEDGVVLVLDQITDPHNVGAILRSAAAFGVAAILVTDRHSPEATGVLAKTASGGLEHVPLITVANLAQALVQLGDRGYWRIGLDSEGATGLDAAVARPPIALVLGAEGKGLRRLTRERCDVLARLDVPGAIKSLNVSNAAAVSLYAVTRALAR